MLSRLFRYIAPWLTLIGFVPMTALAHPHGWVDYRVILHFDDQAHVIALEQVWKMDPFYSLTLTEELAQAEGDESMEERLDMLGEEIANNLRGEHYLTHVTHAGDNVALGNLRDYTIRQGEDHRLTFRFVVPLAEPLALEGSPLTWQIYDDTYYIEFLYDQDIGTPIDLYNAPTDCTSRVIAAAPDPQRVADAAALDRDATAPSGLGHFFAETGEVTCPAR
ncbi:DUF1007 family protein [Modicisalibacter luteus]|uniref:DUF1007 family protein n=1 Tax=Modicisalibacter luteus TaxID=453962 RepID=A0ABV7LYI1_9GAMM|nr:DUF1007 family protein [Halomonas lutea]GHB01922.1 membrane protein [Halomonas lutea]